ANRGQIWATRRACRGPRLEWATQLIQIALGFEELGVEQRGSGGAADGVVREHGELPVEDRAGAQASAGDGHAMAAVEIEARLGTVRALVVEDDLGRGEGQL